MMVTVAATLLLGNDVHAYDKYHFIWLLKRILALEKARAHGNVIVEVEIEYKYAAKLGLTLKKRILILLLISFAPMKLLEQSFDFDDTKVSQFRFLPIKI